jgi:hypothetical protein
MLTLSTTLSLLRATAIRVLGDSAWAILGARLTRATAEEVERLPGVAKDAETIAADSLEKTAEASVTDNTVVGSEVRYPDKASARQAFDGDMRVTANRFFRDATSKSEDFQIAELQGGGHRMQFFSPANNPGYGKLYVQEIDSTGQVVREYKDTLGPNGLIERKWIHGGP